MHNNFCSILSQCFIVLTLIISKQKLMKDYFTEKFIIQYYKMSLGKSNVRFQTENSEQKIKELIKVLGEKDQILNQLVDRIKNQERQISLMIQENSHHLDTATKVPFNFYKEFINRNEINQKFLVLKIIQNKNSKNPAVWLSKNLQIVSYFPDFTHKASKDNTLLSFLSQPPSNGKELSVSEIQCSINPQMKNARIQTENQMVSIDIQTEIKVEIKQTGMPPFQDLNIFSLQKIKLLENDVARLKKQNQSKQAQLEAIQQLRDIQIQEKRQAQKQKEQAINKLRMDKLEFNFEDKQHQNQLLKSHIKNLKEQIEHLKKKDKHNSSQTVQRQINFHAQQSQSEEEQAQSQKHITPLDFKSLNMNIQIPHKKKKRTKIIYNNY